MTPTAAPRINYGSWQAKGLAAWYPMAFPGGRTMFDCSGRRNHGLLDAMNPPVWDWQDGYSVLRFGDANADKVALPEVFGAYSDASLWMWIRGNNNTFSGAPARLTEAADASHYPFSGDSLIYINWMFGTRLNALSDSSFNKDTWHSVCARTAPITNGRQFWQNGIKLGEANGNSTQTIAAADWFIGHSNSGQRWPGWIGEVRVYDYALSDAEIQELAVSNARFDLWAPQVNRTWFLPGVGGGAGIKGGMFSAQTGF